MNEQLAAFEVDVIPGEARDLTLAQTLEERDGERDALLEREHLAPQKPRDILRRQKLGEQLLLRYALGQLDAFGDVGLDEPFTARGRERSIDKPSACCAVERLIVRS